jgi:hypothetical protein
MAFKIKDGVRIGTVDVFNNGAETLNLKVKDTNSGTGAITLNTASLGSTSYIQVLQAKAGTIALTSDITSATVAATTTTLGTIKLGSDTDQTVAANAVTATAGRTYASQFTASDQLVVNVPWTDTTYSKATATVLGLVELFSDTVQGVAANAVSGTAGRTYGIQLNSDQQAVVNVPWTDTLPNNGTLAVSIGTAGATNTTVTWGTATGHSANASANSTYDLKVGPALTNLATLMTGATSGFLKKTAADTYVLDTSTYLTANQTITLSGDVTGSGTTAIITTLATVNSNVGTFNNVTVNGKGLVTAASNVAYLTSFTEADTLQTVTTRGATSNVATISLTANTASSGTGSGTLVVTGGVGIGGALNVGGALTIAGNLIVNGTTTTVNSTTTTLDDPIITLGGDTAPASDDNKDRGVEFRWHNGSAAKLGFFGYDDSTGKFTFIPDASNTAEVFSGTKGTIDANLEWADILSKPKATSTTLGLVELFSDTVQGVAANAVSATASRTYGIQFNAADQMVVNVPWTDTLANNGALTLGIGTAAATNTTVTIGTGTGFTANTASAVTYDIKVGPALTNLATIMTGATSGFLRKTGADTYSLDTSTYLTTQSNDFGVVAIAADSGFTWGAINTNTNQVADSAGDTLTLVTGLGMGLYTSTVGATDAVKIENTDRGSSQSIFKNIANSAGTTQFSASTNNDTIRFAGSGGTSVTFDAGTKTVTISSSEADTLQTVMARGNTTNVPLILNSASTSVSSRLAVSIAVPNNTQIAVDSWPIATFRAAKYLIQITQGENIQISEMLVLHNGASTTETEYAVLETAGSLGTFVTDINATTTFRLLLTLATNAAATVRIDRTAMYL